METRSHLSPQPQCLDQCPINNWSSTAICLLLNTPEWGKLLNASYNHSRWKEENSRICNVTASSKWYSGGFLSLIACWLNTCEASYVRIRADSVELMAIQQGLLSLWPSILHLIPENERKGNKRCHFISFQFNQVDFQSFASACWDHSESPTHHLVAGLSLPALGLRPRETRSQNRAKNPVIYR